MAKFDKLNEKKAEQSDGVEHECIILTIKGDAC